VTDLVTIEPTKAPPVGGGGVQSIARAASLLRALAECVEDGARLGALAAATGLQPATTHRLCRALIDEGWISQRSGHGRYFLGPAVALLASIGQIRGDLRSAALAPLAGLAAETGDTAYLFVRDGLDALCLGRREGGFPIKTLVVDIGDWRPLGTGAAGLAILAALPDAERAATLTLLIGHRAECRTLGRDGLEAALRQARRDGHAWNSGLVPGAHGIGMAITGADGRPVGALSIAAIEGRWQGDRRQAAIAALTRAVEETGETLKARRITP